MRRVPPDAKCPVRPGDPCTLCQLDVTGPHDCPLVYLVMSDDDLHDRLRINGSTNGRQPGRDESTTRA